MSCRRWKSGRRSGASLQHWRMTLTASGGAAPMDTEGRISGGGRDTFSTISASSGSRVSAASAGPGESRAGRYLRA